MTQPAWTLTDKEKIKKTLELIEDFENSGSSKHYKANAQKMRIMLDAIKKTLEKQYFRSVKPQELVKMQIFPVNCLRNSQKHVINIPFYYFF